MISRFRSEAGAEGSARRARRRPGRHRRRHAPAAVEGRAVPRSRPARRRRGTALRRRAQGAAQAAAQEGGRADDDRDADSADAEHVARRHPRHVGDRDAAARPARDPDAGREVRYRRHRPRDPHRARARRPGVSSSTTASSRSTRWATWSRGSCPKRSSPSAHGQMGEDELERVMVDFVAHKFDVLLATTIVENGLDIPNANTIIINRADRYGLAQLYQLRGRVGRSDRRAYAYLLIPRGADALAGRAPAAGGDSRVQRPRQRIPHRRARPRDSRRRQPARRRAERPHRGRRLRHVHEAARGDDPRAQGRGPRGRAARGRQPAARPAHRRDATSRT